MNKDYSAVWLPQVRSQIDEQAFEVGAFDGRPVQHGDSLHAIGLHQIRPNSKLGSELEPILNGQKLRCNWRQWPLDLPRTSPDARGEAVASASGALSGSVLVATDPLTLGMLRLKLPANALWERNGRKG